MLRCALAVVLFFSLLASGFYVSAGEPTMAEHVLVQEQTPQLADACGQGPTGKQPPITGEASSTMEAGSDFDTTALCNSVLVSLTFEARPALAIPFIPVLLLQPFSDGLRRPPRPGTLLA